MDVRGTGISLYAYNNPTRYHNLREVVLALFDPSDTQVEVATAPEWWTPEMRQGLSTSTDMFIDTHDDTANRKWYLTIASGHHVEYVKITELQDERKPPSRRDVFDLWLDKKLSDGIVDAVYWMRGFNSIRSSTIWGVKHILYDFQYETNILPTSCVTGMDDFVRNHMNEACLKVLGRTVDDPAVNSTPVILYYDLFQEVRVQLEAKHEEELAPWQRLISSW